MQTKLREGIYEVLSSISKREKGLIKGVAVVAVALGTFLVIAEYIGINRLQTSPENHMWGIYLSYVIFWLRLRIAVALIISAIGAWFSTVKGFLTIALTLLWLTVEYTLWFFWSIRVYNNLGVGRLPEPSAAGFYHATWLDILVLSLTFVLLAWVIRIFILILGSLQNGPNDTLLNETHKSTLA